MTSLKHAVLPEAPGVFGRPVSIGLYWCFTTHFLPPSPVAVHLFNFFIYIIPVAQIGLLSSLVFPLKKRVLPVLALFLYYVFESPKSFPRLSFIFSLTMIPLWFLVRAALVVPPSPDSLYALSVGSNLFRNLLSLLAFSLNVSRESLRFFMTRHSLWALLWGGLSLFFQPGALILFFRL